MTDPSSGASLKREVGHALRRLRAERGFSQAEISRRSGLSTSRMSRYEAGETEPSLTSLKRILDALGVSLTELDEALETLRSGEEPDPEPDPEVGRPVLFLGILQELPGDTKTRARVLPPELETILWNQLSVAEAERKEMARRLFREWLEKD
jgi:transcriptional regulator with XRE-family HTH domain